MVTVLRKENKLKHYPQNQNMTFLFKHSMIRFSRSTINYKNPFGCNKIVLSLRSQMTLNITIQSNITNKL